MPRTSSRHSTNTFNFGRTIGVTIISLLAGLSGTAVASMFSLYSRVATLTDNVQKVTDAFNKHLDNSVPKDAYLRRDAEIQQQISEKATKDDVRLIQHQLDEQSMLLHSIETAVSQRKKQ